MKYWIEQGKTKVDYTIHLSHDVPFSDYLFESLFQTQIVPFGYLLGPKECRLKADSVCSLKELMDSSSFTFTVDMAESFLDGVYKQIHFLKTKGYSFYGFDIEDILVINHQTFGVVYSEYILPFNSGFNSGFDSLSFLVPFTKPYFSSPEIIELTELPCVLSYKTCYYSLASLIVYLLLDEYIFKANEVKTDAEIDTILKPIFFTKLYWCLKRCLYRSVDQRVLLYV